jgi:hypothetical protein
MADIDPWGDVEVGDYSEKMEKFGIEPISEIRVECLITGLFVEALFLVIEEWMSSWKLGKKDGMLL